VTSSAQLSIDVPHADGDGPPVPAPCQILDARLRPIDTTMADGYPHRVPAGRIILLITLAPGDLRRVNVALERDGNYRLRLHRNRPAAVAELADAEALETMRLLDAGLIEQAQLLADRRLPAIEKGELNDPIAVTAVAYAYIQARNRKRLGSWCLDLAHRHPEVPDGFVIGGEWHAMLGNHLTALSYLRRLSGSPLPIFALGVTRALDRLAGYRTLSLDQAPSVRLRRGELPDVAAGQLLNRWDVEAAKVLFTDLNVRSGRRPPATVLSTIPVPDQPAVGVWARVGSLERALIRRFANASSRLSRR